MKRIFLILLVLLVLAGCAVDDPAETTTTTPTVPPTEPKGTYIANSTLEQQSDGAIRVYLPEGGDCIGITAVGGNLVMITDKMTLVMLEGENGLVKATLKLDENLHREELDIHATADALSCYLPSRREVVTVNSQLLQTGVAELPEGMTGLPVVSHSRAEVYYCEGKSVKAMNMKNGVSRIVKDLVCQRVELIGSYFDGDVLALKVTDDQLQEQSIYIDTETGQTLAEDPDIQSLESWENFYMARRQDGIVQQQLFGTLGEEPKNLDIPDHAQALLPMGGAVSSAEVDNRLVLDYYGLNTGKHSASVELLGVKEPTDYACDGHYIWFLAEADGKQMLCRWDVTASPTQDTADYVFPFFTKSNQDQAGLAKCRERAAVLQQTHGVSILIGTDALAVQGDFLLEEEYQTNAINLVLDGLEKVFRRFPEGFLRRSIKNGQINVSIVRSISGDKTMAQFYNGGDAYIVIPVDCDIEKNFIHGFGYVLDSFVLGNSRDFDDWDRLNPKGFQYDYSYYLYEQKTDVPYLSGEDRAFVNTYSMTYPHEDRCSIFLAAMTADNGETFQSATMQKKLKRVCEGIREAWGLERSKETFLWEQYLNE